MHDEPAFDPELDRLAARLAALPPRAEWQRDSLMFAAGRASANRRLRTANRALAATSLALAGLVVVLPFALRRGGDPLQASMSESQPPSAHAPPSDEPPHEPRHEFDASPSMAEGPTHFRLRQGLASESRSDHAPAASGPASLPTSIERSPIPSSRELLRDYLQTS
ncbi:MAG: hypothetical protein DWQ37_04550 [Planctomycetota bacterium]|nr:MAG: hypothetical protein DWQ37_04550 [Planctomycetota bacterium]